MNELLEQIESASIRGDFYLALFACLAVPDICGALSAADGSASGVSYKKWFDSYVAPKYDGNFTGENCYAFRCSALHQGRSDHRKLGYERILFVAPSRSGAVMHNNVLNDALNLDIKVFCADVVAGARQWMQDQQGNELVEKNMNTLLRRFPGGLKPYIVGIDVYS